MVGDFNNLELPSDRWGGSRRVLSGTELRAWHHFKWKLCLEDSFVAKLGHPCFSWVIRDATGTIHLLSALLYWGSVYIIKWLDHIYLSTSSRTYLFSLLSTILPGFCLSDHAPILVALKTNGIAIHPSLYRVNSSHLKDKELLDRLTSLWEGIKLEMLEEETEDGAKVEKRFFKGLYDSKKITRAYNKEKAKKRCEKEDAM